MGARFAYKSLEKNDDLRQIQVLPAVISGKPTFPAPDMWTAGAMPPCALNLQFKVRVLAMVPGAQPC